MTAAAFTTLLQFVLLLAISPLLSGCIKTLKARLQMRRGPGVLQPYHDLYKLLRKGMVIPDTASWLFQRDSVRRFSHGERRGADDSDGFGRGAPGTFRRRSGGGLSARAGTFRARTGSARYRQLVRRVGQQPGNDDIRAGRARA